MDTFDVETKPRAIWPTFLPMAIALGSCVLSVIALFITASAKHKQSQAEVQFRAAQSQLAAFEARLSRINSQTEELSEMDDVFIQQMKSMADQIQEAFHKLNKEVVAQAELLDKMQKAGPVLQVARQSKAAHGRVAQDIPGVYIVQSGDTLGRVAQVYNIALSDILSANPDINPRRLQIGQKIVIPSR